MTTDGPRRQALNTTRPRRAFPARWRSSGGSMPWSRALVVRCISGGARASMTALSISVSAPSVCRSASLPAARAVRATRRPTLRNTCSSGTRRASMTPRCRAFRRVAIARSRGSTTRISRSSGSRSEIARTPPSRAATAIDRSPARTRTSSRRETGIRSVPDCASGSPIAATGGPPDPGVPAATWPPGAAIGDSLPSGRLTTTPPPATLSSR